MNLAFTDIHSLGLVSLSLLEADGYYIGHFGDGAILITISDNTLRQATESQQNQSELATRYQEFIEQFQIKAQKKILNHYLLAKGYQIIEDNKNSLIAHQKNN